MDVIARRSSKDEAFRNTRGRRRFALLDLFFRLSGAHGNTIPEVVTGRGFTGWRQNTRATGGGARQERGFLFFGLLLADP